MAKQFSAENKALPLSLRKNIRDNSSKVQDNLTRVEKATGVSGWTFDVEADIAALNNAIDSSYKDRLGEIFADYSDNVAQLLEREMQDSMVKETFLEAATKKAIIARQVSKKPEGQYIQPNLENGTLYLDFVPESVWTNIYYDVATFKLEKLSLKDSKQETTTTTSTPSPAGNWFSAENKSLPLTLRKDIRDSAAKAGENLARIAKATGVDGWSFGVEADVLALNSAVDSSYKDRLGEIFTDYLENVAQLLEREMKDELVKATFVEAIASTKSIIARQVKQKPEDQYILPNLGSNGVFYFDFIPESVWTNVYYDIASFKLEKLFNGQKDYKQPSKQFSSENKALPLALRKDIRENATKEFDNLTRIDKATGVTGWSFNVEADIVALNNAVDSSYKNRLGEIFADYTENVAQLFEREMKDDLTKETFLDVAKQKSIIARQVKVKPADQYIQPKIENGVFYLDFIADSLWTNIYYDVASFKLEKLL